MGTEGALRGPEEEEDDTGGWGGVMLGRGQAGGPANHELRDGEDRRTAVVRMEGLEQLSEVSGRQQGQRLRGHHPDFWLGQLGC